VEEEVEEAVEEGVETLKPAKEEAEVEKET
jgi:hypothetical protein